MGTAIMNKSPPNKITLSAPVPHWTVLPVGVDLNPLKRRQMSGSSCTGDTSTLPPLFCANSDVKLPTGAEAEATLTPRPWTRILKSSEDYAEGTVLKREARARSDGRAFFTGPSKASEDDIAQMLTDNASGPYRWFVQEEIPFLRNVGEWRAYLVGCEVVGIVATTSVEENGCEVQFRVSRCNYPIGQLKEVLGPSSACATTTDILDRQGGSREDELERGPGTNFFSTVHSGPAKIVMDALAQLLIGLAKANAEADTDDPTGGTDGSEFVSHSRRKVVSIAALPLRTELSR
ncbi:hypothetical protein B0H14DRAFT_2614837 [Mycena olivaceomarginata]|nr:hypothetical protein B0H14DRAFT_2614837 [Mycena olivaceomarginata]